MNSSEPLFRDAGEQRLSTTSRIIAAAAGLISIMLTYLVAANNTGNWRFVAVAAIGTVFAAVCLKMPERRRPAPEAFVENGSTSELTEFEDRLIALDEASDVFVTSLSAADMFRLVSSRVCEIYPFSASVLVVQNEAGDANHFLHADGLNSGSLRGIEIGINEGLAGRAAASGRTEIDNTLKLDANAIGPERVSAFISSVAMPLGTGPGMPVFQIFCSVPIANDDDTLNLFETIREHVGPIFRSSLAFERSMSSALTDTLTSLPNERAFRIVLENQLAESMRNRNVRPLSILSIDIRDFGAVNSMLGHAAGDRMLEFTSETIAESLRKMDFLARMGNDEFSVILPTASERVAFEIIERIRASFTDREFEIIDGETIAVNLNIGWATFWKDGETVDQLIRSAQHRKRQAKSETSADVMLFPKQYVN